MLTTRRPNLHLRRSRACAIVLLCTAAVATATFAQAEAATPVGGSRFMVHDHDTVGDGWHIELTVSKDSRTLRQVVMHSERCDETVLTSGVKIRAGGDVASSKSFETSGGARGTWRLDAAFAEPHHVEGTFQVTTPGCAGGVRAFSADSEGHRDGAHHHGHLYGTPPGSYPDLGKATRRQRAEARRLWQRSLRAAEIRFPDYGTTRALGFRPKVEVFPRPLALHLRRRAYALDDRSFDARRPESLVYWWPAEGEPVLVAFMYRYPMGRRPRFGGRILGWHTHGGETQMTHVWMTKNLRTALANCMPVAALESALPTFRYSTPAIVGTPDSHPCPVEPPK